MESPSDSDSSANTNASRETQSNPHVSAHHDKKIHKFTEKSHKKHHGKHKKHHQSAKHQAEDELRLPLAAHPDHHDDHHDENGHNDLQTIIVSQDSPIDTPKKYFGGRISADTLKLIHVAFCFMILLVRIIFPFTHTSLNLTTFFSCSGCSFNCLVLNWTYLSASRYFIAWYSESWLCCWKFDGSLHSV